VKKLFHNSQLSNFLEISALLLELLYMARRTAGSELTGALQGFKHAYSRNILKTKLFK
jgi:hypothetical protein